MARVHLHGRSRVLHSDLHRVFLGPAAVRGQMSVVGG